MAPEPCCAAAGTGRRRARLAWTVVPGVALAALPKCPLCLVAYLSAIGIGAGVATPLAHLVVPIVRVIAVVALAAVAVASVRVTRRARRAARRADRAVARLQIPDHLGRPRRV
jgi:hypothetical protein